MGDVTVPFHPAPFGRQDVVWQRLGTGGVYLNTPMTSGSENLLYCPRNYVMPPPVNYGFNVVGTRSENM